MSRQATLEEGVRVTGAAPMWTRILELALAHGAPLLPPGSSVVEVGYGDGSLTCHLAQRFGWRITGFDVLASAHRAARERAREAGVGHLLDLRLVEPDETWRHEGQYDGVFIKTVLYNARSLAEYGRWLDWVRSVLVPRGVFINFENGKANLLTYLYRKLRHRYYTNLCMYDGRIHSLYEARFDLLWRGHFGAVSQFLAPLPRLYRLAAAVEERLWPRTADNSFVTALVARKHALA